MPPDESVARAIAREVILTERRHVQQAIDLQAVELHEDSEVDNARHDPVVRLADVLLHVIALEPRDRAARRFIGATLAKGAVLAQDWQWPLPVDQLRRVAFSQDL